MQRGAVRSPRTLCLPDWFVGFGLLFELVLSLPSCSKLCGCLVSSRVLSGPFFEFRGYTLSYSSSGPNVSVDAILWMNSTYYTITFMF